MAADVRTPAFAGSASFIGTEARPASIFEAFVSATSRTAVCVRGADCSNPIFIDWERGVTAR